MNNTKHKYCKGKYQKLSKGESCSFYELDIYRVQEEQHENEATQNNAHHYCFGLNISEPDLSLLHRLRQYLKCKCIK